ncbi:MAG TPA: di-heme oxidoredictase family protein [Kofleriaceae bacterium]|nr:di-heme oxidoredictase family protein [Kofleriaceae bacterium]
MPERITEPACGSSQIWRWPGAVRGVSVEAVRLVPISVCVLAACGDGGPGESRQGGDGTVEDRTVDAFLHPAQNLTADERSVFQAGRGPFDFHWEIPLLGPLFNNDSCLGCHAGNGRGVSQIGNGALVSQALIRVSLLDGQPEVPGGDVPVPGLGLQLQDHATSGLPEVTVTLSWVEHPETLGDGEVVMLREPRVRPVRIDGSELGAEIRTSYRQAPGLFGVGLLEAVPEAQILALADPDDADGDGISGRANQVWDPDVQATVLGRFGHKATVSTLRQQIAAAFAIDMGLSNKLLPEPDGMRDVSDDQFEQVLFFVSTIAVPAAAPQNAAARRGRGLFDELGCAGCHVATLTTGDHAIPELAHQTIHPYTDLLLHDVGDLLTDARRDFLAEGVEWRTPPLWGLGLVQLVSPDATFLHDGRARTLTEAILWHGGEALAAREAFRLASKDQRDALIAFLQTL